jgi:hypothetical protein
LKSAHIDAFIRSMSFLMRPLSTLVIDFSWRCRNLKFKLRFCDGVFISSCIRLVVFAIKIRLRSALTHCMSFLESLHSSPGTYFSWRCRNLKFKLRFCDAFSISSCIRQVVFAIKNPTTQCFNALHELSNETSLVSGDLFFMEMSKFEVQVPFL